MNYSNIQQDGLSGVGLLNVNPDFVDSSNNYNLNESSLCIDAGNLVLIIMTLMGQ